LTRSSSHSHQRLSSPSRSQSQSSTSFPSSRRERSPSRYLDNNTNHIQTSTQNNSSSIAPNVQSENSSIDLTVTNDPIDRHDPHNQLPVGNMRALNLLSEEQKIERIRNDSNLRIQIIHSYLNGEKKSNYHRNYTKVVADLKKDKVWYLMGTQEMENHCADFAKIFDVNPATFRNWNRKLKNDKDWPGPTYRKSQRGHIFSCEQENALYSAINTVIDQFHQPMTNYLFRFIVVAFYQSNPYDELQQPNLKFNASDKFIKKFRKKFNLSRRRAHI